MENCKKTRIKDKVTIAQEEMYPTYGMVLCWWPWLTSKCIVWVCQHQLSFLLTPKAKPLLTWEPLLWKLNIMWLWKSPSANDDMAVFLHVAYLWLICTPHYSYFDYSYLTLRLRRKDVMDTCPPKFRVTWIQGQNNHYANCAQLSEVRDIVSVLTRNKDKQTQKHCTNNHC